MRREVEVYTVLMGFDATLRVEYEITSWGSPAVIDYVWGGEPAEPPEWCVEEIGVTLALDNGDGAEWLPDWRSKAFTALAQSTRVEQVILDDIASIDRPRRGRRGRRYWDDAA